VRTQSTKRKSVRRLQPEPLPIEYSCIDPEEATHLFDYLNGAASDLDKESLTAHLGLCFSCQEAVARRKNLDKVLLQQILVDQTH